jgi:fructosamine-3-kinase
MADPLIAAVRRRLGAAAHIQPLAASGFAATVSVQRGAARFFVKVLPQAQGERLRAEAEGLQALAATQTIRVPRVADCGDAEGYTLLALEWLDFAPPDARFGERFGAALAALHAAPAPHAGYGWPRDNWLGGSRQEAGVSGGTGTRDWMAFWRERRLLALARRLAHSRYAALIEAAERAADAMPALFADGHEPRPSLIHGDLWSGNWGMLADGTPVIFDPAVSVSDAEAELAMMELFGAPPAGFFAAYRRSGHLAAGYPQRRPVYQLYHLLNHVLLFGDAYASAAQRCAREAARAAHA